MYLQEIQTASISLTRMGDDLCPLNFPRSLVDQVALLVRGVARKDNFLASVRVSLMSTYASISVAQRDIKSLRLENASLAQCLNDYFDVSLMVVRSLFRNPSSKWSISIILCISQGSRFGRIRCSNIGRLFP